MQYRRLGKAGIKLSEVGLGSWLTYGGATETSVAHACIHRAVEHGINFFDTANVYAAGEAEKVLAAALADYRRDAYVLASKVYFPMGDGPNDRGLSRKHIFEQCHQSLRRLRTDYLDLYQCHRFDEETPLEETLRALDDLVTQGKILYVGVSQWSAHQIKDALHLAERLNLDRVVSNQPVYNMLHRELEFEVMPLCQKEGIGQVVFSPLAQGVLTGKYKAGQPAAPGTRATDPRQNQFLKLDEQELLRVQQLEPIAHRLGLTTGQLALAWCLREPIVTSVICGATRPEQVDENAGAAGVPLPDDVLQDIENLLG